MRLTYNDIFKCSDRLNPLSSRTLFLAGKLAELGPKRTLLDLGSGKGFPSLLWASAFGVRVEGFDLNSKYVKFANSYARLLNLEHLVKYSCRDIRGLKIRQKYDAIAFLGIGVGEIYGTTEKALENFRLMLKTGGFLLLAEPVWLIKKVPEKVQEALGTPEEDLRTKVEMERLLKDHNFEVRGSYVSTKEDWEYYIRPVNVAMREMMRSQPELLSECQVTIDNFQAEYQAAGKDWDMLLWIAKALE